MCIQNKEQCSICLSDINNSINFGCRDMGTVGFTMPCEHYFHISCILEWLRSNASCPLCRQNIDEDIIFEIENLPLIYTIDMNILRLLSLLYLIPIVIIIIALNSKFTDESHYCRNGTPYLCPNYRDYLIAYLVGSIILFLWGQLSSFHILTSNITYSKQMVGFSCLFSFPITIFTFPLSYLDFSNIENPCDHVGGFGKVTCRDTLRSNTIWFIAIISTSIPIFPTIIYMLIIVAYQNRCRR